MPNIIEQIIEKAKKLDKDIVFPESSDKRILEAVEHIYTNGIANVILIGNKAEILKNRPSLDLSKIRIVDPGNFDRYEEYVQRLVEKRQHKGMTRDKARELLRNHLYFGAMMLDMNDADGVVAGASSKTDDVLRAALQVVKTMDGVKSINGSYIMCLPKARYGDNGVLVFADCAIIPEPTAEQLADIAISSAYTAKKLIGVEPRVAMLSFSTKGSSKHPGIIKVAEAVKIAAERMPELKIDGEMQVDAALVEEVAQMKLSESSVSGKANVLVFPDLNSANIAYKLVQRLAEAKVIGLVTQGLTKPVNDLSRGCSVQDIINLTAGTVLQSDI